MPRPRILVVPAIFPEILAQLQRHFDVESNQACVLAPDVLAERMRDKHGILVTAYEQVTAAMIANSPDLAVISNMAVGYDNIDVAAATDAGVMVTNTPFVLDHTTADFAWTMLLAAARRAAEADRWVRQGRWERWAYDGFLGAEVHGTTLGILGMGRIGRLIARRSMGFDMKVLYHNRSRLSADEEHAANHATYVAKHELLRAADHVILMLPYSPSTHHTIGAPELAIMRPTATLVNLARGGVVDDAALVDALQARRIAAAALDVFENEPKLHPAFLTLDNVLLSPHMASASERTRRSMAGGAADGLIAALTGGRPAHLVNREVRR